MHNFFDFRVLRQNRRVVKDENGTAARQADLDNFHRVLMNISEGKATQRVRDFIAPVLSVFEHSVLSRPLCPLKGIASLCFMSSRTCPRSEVNAYARGALAIGGCIEKAGTEGSTAVFTKRRFREPLAHSHTCCFSPCAHELRHCEPCALYMPGQVESHHSEGHLTYP